MINKEHAQQNVHIHLLSNFIKLQTCLSTKNTCDYIKNEVWLSLANSFTDPSYFQNLVVYYQNNGYTLKIDTVIDQEVNIVDRSALKAYQDDGFKCN